tara:strand:+ start:2026 stop:2739 length:714 start_codon:yes stop_codon:yes gene_type:complete
MLKYFFERIILILDNSSQKKNFFFIKKIFGNKLNTFFDVGFHEGETAKLVNEFFSVKEIHAFEANPNISKSFYESKFKNVVLVKKGVGRKNCKKTFFINNFSPINSFFKVDNQSRHTRLKQRILNFLYSENINSTEREVEIITLKNYCLNKRILSIDVLKIDTEGSEYDILMGLGKNIKNVKCILFEHHYDKSLIKNYKFSDINKLLVENGFKKVFKTKMVLRNIIEYVYLNEKSKL